MMNKTCIKCDEEQIEDNFNVIGIPSGRTGEVYRRDVCKVCFNREQKKQRDKDPRPHILSTTKCRAKRKGIPFSITLEDIIIPKYCPVLGLKLERGKGKHQDNSPALDKIIPALGYVPGNVEIISNRANTLKRDATPKELKLLADYYN